MLQPALALELMKDDAVSAGITKEKENKTPAVTERPEMFL
jgi:hypothetical protein